MKRRRERTPRKRKLAQKLLLALNLFEAGLTMMRENLLRRYPGISKAALERKLRFWLRDRPPDGPGRLVRWGGERR